AFATPIGTDPLAFNWDALLHAPGSEKIAPLGWASVGVLSIAFAAIPMQSLPRGVLGTVLGPPGFFAPSAVGGPVAKPRQLRQCIGMLALVRGLLLRNEYTESVAARVLVTVGVASSLLIYLVPEGGQIPLVQVFKDLLNAGSHMELVIIKLAHIVLLVLCLL